MAVVERWVVGGSTLTYPAICVARIVLLWRPLPPTPTNRALPPGILRTRQMREMCSMANINITRFMGLRELLLG